MRLGKKEFDKAEIKCHGCKKVDTKWFLSDCEDCCGTPCWHEETESTLIGRKKTGKMFCCDCWAEKPSNKIVDEAGKNCCPTYPSVKFMNISNSELITEFGNRIKQGKLKLVDVDDLLKK